MTNSDKVNCIKFSVKTHYLEHTASLLVDEAGDPLDAAPPGQTSDGGLGDALDVVPEHLPVPLGASLPQSLASFASSGHYLYSWFCK